MVDQFAQNYANKGIVRLREIFTPGTLQVPKTQTALKELESIHKVKSLHPFFEASVMILGILLGFQFPISLVEKFHSLMESFNMLHV